MTDNTDDRRAIFDALFASKGRIPRDEDEAEQAIFNVIKMWGEIPLENRGK